MIYVLAVLLPPLGLALVGKPWQALLNLALWLTVIGWPVAAIWAVAVIVDVRSQQRTRQVVDALRRRE